jgi:hypothetical protein
MGGPDELGRGPFGLTLRKGMGGGEAPPSKEDMRSERFLIGRADVLRPGGAHNSNQLPMGALTRGTTWVGQTLRSEAPCVTARGVSALRRRQSLPRGSEGTSNIIRHCEGRMGAHGGWAQIWADRLDSIFWGGDPGGDLINVYASGACLTTGGPLANL